LDQGGSSRAAIAIAATLAHEIKNPLSGIRGAAQLLEGAVEGNDVSLTRLIRTEVDRIAALIDRMEGFTDTRPIELAGHNIHAIVDHARSVAQQGFGAHLSIVEEYDPSLPPVLAHGDSLIQVVINLLKNAAETAVPGETRSVTLSTRYRHGVMLSSPDHDRRLPLPIELCVIDDGPGAPPDMVEQLFDPFISSKRSGQGLGLALADKLIRDMGGLIQYGREGNPPRTTFRLLLQRARGK
jgi:two-component system, NtrC family, nitrogen regulation sensor histidine kinase GlnL